jgi:response regulator RpfG family c-di-GMP phosphodiesterase
MSERENNKSNEAEISPERREEVAEILKDKTILAIDDEAQIRKVMKRLFRESNVLDIALGKEAIRQINEGLKPDAIISDIMMPEMSGKDLYEQLMEKHPDLARKVLFITGGTFARSDKKGSDGLKEFIQQRTEEGRIIEKPFDPEHFRERVASIIENGSAKKPELNKSKEADQNEEELDFAGWIGHKINNPLTTVQFNSEELKTAFESRDQLTVDDWGLIYPMIESCERIIEAIDEIGQKIDINSPLQQNIHDLRNAAVPLSFNPIELKVRLKSISYIDDEVRGIINEIAEAARRILAELRKLQEEVVSNLI